MIIANVFNYIVCAMTFTRSKISFSVLAVFSSTLYANEQVQLSPTAPPNNLVELNTITVIAEKSIELGKTTYTKESLQKIPNSSKSITDVLKLNPNVQFSNDHMAASKQANLKPSEISIHGAQAFQNKFIINGVSNTNILDPNGAGTANYGGMSSGSQGVAINTDLLCELEVLDSNVSAKHGGFTGGVIQADTCAPTTEIGKMHGSISYDYTSSEWVQYHIETDADKGLFEGESTQSNQKEYTRQGFSTNVYSKLSDTYGLNMYGSLRQSVIPVESGLDSPKKIDQKKQNSNIGGTLFVNPNNDTAMKFGFTLGDLEDNNYSDRRRNSHNTVNNDSTILFAEVSKKLDIATIKQKINFQKIDNTRQSDETTSVNWLYAAGSKDWTNTAKVFDGAAAANIHLEQSTFNYELDSVFNTLAFAKSKHTFSAGLGYKRDEVKWERPTDFATHYGITSGNATNLVNLNGEKCQINDPLCDEATTAPFKNPKNLDIFQGQYFISGNLFKAGNFAGNYDQAHIYVEDAIEWNKLNAKLGLRADYDSSNNNLNFAPRTNFSYTPFTNHRLNLVAGWNRYFSAPTYVTDLLRNMTDLDFTIDREDQNSEWVESPKYSAVDTRKSDLKTPYADEFVLGFSNQIKNTNFALKWVNRQYKDEITRERTPIAINGFNRSFEYGNSGYGENDTVTLEVATVHPLKWKGSKHDLGLAVNYSDSFRGTPDYTEDYNEADMNELISYNGEIIEYGDRPASNYNQPMTARVLWNVGFDRLPLNISNFISYKDSYEQIISSANKVVHEGSKLDTYNKEDVKPRFTWDMRATYDYQIAKDYNAIFGLTINNITDRNNLYVSGSKLYSEIGRQFIADITFKF